MAEARQREEWVRTASLMALVANAHRDPKKGRPFRPADFDPFQHPRNPRNSPSPRTPTVGIGVLKTVFVDPLKRTPPHTDAGKEATP